MLVCVEEVKQDTCDTLFASLSYTRHQHFSHPTIDYLSKNAARSPGICNKQSTISGALLKVQYSTQPPLPRPPLLSSKNGNINKVCVCASRQQYSTHNRSQNANAANPPFRSIANAATEPKDAKLLC